MECLNLCYDTPKTNYTFAESIHKRLMETGGLVDDIDLRSTLEELKEQLDI